MFFENRNARCYFWRKTGKPKNRGETGKNEEKSVFYWIEPYLYEFDAIESRFGIYTRKTEESLFEIWCLQNTLRLISCASTE
jgi:hypothetical protein